MIVSHLHKFIFIKTTKTAGTSIEIALSQHCGPEDIITPIQPEDEEIRRRLGFRGPQNHLDTAAAKAASQAVSPLFYNHMPAREIRAQVGDKIWSDYHKLCFERHPCERVISFFFFRRRLKPQLTIAELIDSRWMRWLRKTGYHLYTIDGRIVVDKVGLYEKLQRDLDEFSGTVGLPQLELLRTKDDYRVDRRDFRSILTPEERAKIGRIFAPEIALFGYEC